MSVNGGDCRFAVPPNPGTVRIRVGFTDCGGWDCWECQAPGTPILYRVRTPNVVFSLGSPVDFCGLGVTFCAVFKQSGTASIHYRNRPFTRLVPMIVLLLGADRPPSSDWRESLCFQPIPLLCDCLSFKRVDFEV